MGTDHRTPDFQGKRARRASSLRKEIEDTREKMETETHTFIEGATKFSLEWIQREMSSNISQLKNQACSENIEIGKDRRINELPHLEDLPFRIQEIVEKHLNKDDYWIHRSSLLHTDISRDYIEFKKEKTRKDLTSSIRMILGCAAEIFAGVKDESPESKVWVKERGRRKYICILRFSDEMTASLDRYFSMLEELFFLEYEMNKEIEKKQIMKESKRSLKSPEKDF